MMTYVSIVRSLFWKNFNVKKFVMMNGEKKRFSDFSETLHINSTPRENFEIFLVKLENFLMGLKIDFEFFELGQI